MLLSTSLFGQRINLKVGEEFAIEAANKSVSNVDGRLSTQTQTNQIQFRMLGDDKEGIRLQCTLLKSRISLVSTKGNQKIVFKLNSDSLAFNKVNSISAFFPLACLQKPFEVVLSPSGRLIRLEGIDTLINRALKRWDLPASSANLIAKNINNDAALIVNSMFFELPEKRLSYQYQWTDIDHINYQVIGIRGAILDIAASASAPKLQGSYLLNEVNGLLENATISVKDKNVSTDYSQKVSYGKHNGSLLNEAIIDKAVATSSYTL